MINGNFFLKSLNNFLQYNLRCLMGQGESVLVWIDLEMTGLNPQEHVILEIATIVTNNNLDIIGYGPAYAIFQNDEELLKMDDWVLKAHTASGLLQAVKESNVILEQAQAETLNFLKNYTIEGKAPLCGNSVWQDRRFIRKYMPELDNFLNYRIIDVSSIKEVVTRWYPDSIRSKFVKPENHRALEDIIYSIEELRHYRTYFFLPNL